MAVEAKKQFLDYAGLSTLWSIITNRFADKDKTILGQEITFNDNKKKASIVTTLADNTTQVVTELPNADRTQSGLMSADHYAMVEDLTANIESMAPFAGLQLANEIGEPYTEEVSLTGRKATIALRYESTNEEGVRKAYISLLDPNYPAEGRWNSKSEVEFLVAQEAAIQAGTTLVGWTSYTADGTTQYYQWSEAGETGPVNALGKPIAQKPISKIDVTDLLRTGLLSNTDVVSVGGKTNLKLDFITKSADGTEEIQSQYIDVTDLVDIYEAGDGVEIIDRTSEPTLNEDGELDYTATTTKIQLTYATDDKRGAIRTGYTADEDAIRHYAVQLVQDGDAAGKAYVAVPWDTHEVEFFTTGKDANENEYLTITDLSTTIDGKDGSKNHSHKFQVEVGNGIKNAEKLARTAAQELSGDEGFIVVEDTQLGDSAEKGEGKNWSITLDQTVKDSLALADSAVQSVAVDVVDRDGRSTGDDLNIELVKDPAGKGEKGYTITLGARTVESLQYADSAVQSVSLFGNELSGNEIVYTEDDLTKDIELGNAIKYNVADSISEDTFESEASYEEGKQLVNLPTVEATKTYVDNVHKEIFNPEDSTGELVDFVDAKIAELDSTVEIDTIDADSTAQGESAKTVFTKIVIKDGKLVAPNTEGVTETSEVASIGINDIVDFRALSEDEIKTICI
jgi:hypothetical protein